MPLYYFGMPSQLKAVIDRFYAFNDLLLEKTLKSILIAVFGDDEDWVPKALESHYETVCHYLGWKDIGRLLAPGFYTRKDIENSHYPSLARELGSSLHHKT